MPLDRFKELVDIVEKLRSPDGCEWDKALTLDSIKTYLLEEAYEVYDAIIDEDHTELEEELGDLLLEVVLIAQIEKEAGHFDIRDSLKKINEKMIRRHPHVFGDLKTKDVNKILINWEEIKRKEKKHRMSYLDGVPRTLPSVMRAFKIQEKASRVGFDWDSLNGIKSKVREEFEELEKELSKLNEENIKNKIINDEQLKRRIEDEIGDCFFVLINLSRQLTLDPEAILTKTISKFTKRFQYIERKLSEVNRPIKDASLEEMDAFWDESKDKGL
jgi:tetrapyrrole methylase family protein / MazG family protein